MLIARVETILLTGPSTDDPFLAAASPIRSAAFIQITTDDGQSGLGETYAGYFCPEAVPAIVEFFAPILVGQDPTDPVMLHDRMLYAGNYWCRTGLGRAVLTGLEAALWDLAGKAAGLPVYKLLGDAGHQQLLAYATGGPSNYPPDELARKIESYRNAGFIAAKVGTGSWSPDEGRVRIRDGAAAAAFEADKLSTLRRRFGSDFKLMLDGHNGPGGPQAWDLEAAVQVVQAVEPFDLVFFEEPLPYDDPGAYARLRAASSVPIAGGEVLAGREEWRAWIDADAFDIGQPDASFCGGLFEFKAISRMFEERGRAVATHAWGAGGCLMQNVHAAFATPNVSNLEVPPRYGPLHYELMGDSFQMNAGYVLPPEQPGFGIELTDETRRRWPFRPGSGESRSVPGKLRAGT